MNVVVWEWQEFQGIWIPYSVKVSHFLEMSDQKGLIVVNLGEVDQSLACYDVDLNAKTQTRQETGMIRQIKRTLYPANYPCGQGIAWQWCNDLRWIPYNMETAYFIEKQYQRDCKCRIDLESSSLGIPNVIELSRMVQVNKFTLNERLIQRKVDRCFQYPIDNTNRAVTSASLDAYKNSTSLPLTTSSATNYSASSSNGLSVNVHDTSRSKEKLESENKRMKVMTGDDNSDQLHLYCKATTKLDDLDEECSICFEKLKDLSGFHDSSSNVPQSSMDVRELKKCPHKFHGTCLLALTKTSSKEGWMQCPTCKVIQGIKLGIQPKDGTMSVSRQGQSLPGHPGCGMITITYNFSSGIQGPEHPHPGKHYYASGFPRQCYLPDSSKGQKVLKLLQKAWKRRLIFTIATSNTTGQEDTVVWNEIHHKTEPFSNVSGHGFPDPNYLDNVLTELSIQGVDDSEKGQE